MCSRVRDTAITRSDRSGTYVLFKSVYILVLRRYPWKLKQKNAVLREDTLRLSSSAQEQISALRFESQKMEDAAEQCISV